MLDARRQQYSESVRAAKDAQHPTTELRQRTAGVFAPRSPPRAEVSALRFREFQRRPAITSALAFQLRRHRERQFLSPRTADDLDPDRQTFRRLSHRYYGSWISQQIEPLGIAPGVQILHRLAVDDPTAFAVPEGWNRRRRTQQDGKHLHLRQKPGAQFIPLDRKSTRLNSSHM